MNNGNFQLLQLFYAAALVDTANNYHEAAITEQIAEKKGREQNAAAAMQLTRLGAQNPVQLFEKMSEIFGCVQWETETVNGTTCGRTKSCLMCSIAKKTGAAKPCDLFCIGPMRAFGGAFSPVKKLTVEKTLWENDACVFVYQ